MSTKKPGDPFGFQFVLLSLKSGDLVNASGEPWGTMVRNGVDDMDVMVAIDHLAPGVYNATGTIPIEYAGGDELQVRINAQIEKTDWAMVHNYGTLAEVNPTVSLAPDGLDAIVVEPGSNFRQAQALILNACCSVLTGATGGPGTITISDPTGTQARITAVVDQHGNRTAVTHSPPP